MSKTSSQNSFHWLTKKESNSSLIRNYDWSQTSIGIPETWPKSFKAVLNLCLESGYPMFIRWGRDLLSFYNDAYIEILGPDKHPSLFANSAKKVWPEVWDTVQTFIDRVYQGETVIHTDMLMPINRYNQLQDAYFSFSYSPARNDDDEINGVICICQETTKNVLSENKLKLAYLATENAHKQLHDFFMQAPAPMVILLGNEFRFWIANEPYEELVGRKVVGKTLMEAFSNEEVLHFLPLLEEVYTTGVSYIGKEIPFHPKIDGLVQNRFLNIGYHPFIENDNTIKGILALVEDVTEQVILRAQVEESRNELHVLSESIPQIIWTAGPDGVLDYTNSIWADYSGSKLPGDWENFIHPDDINDVANIWAQSVSTGNKYETEFRLRRKDGIYHSFLVRALVAKNSKDEIIKWYGTCTDIELQKLTVIQLEQEKAVREQFVSMLTHDLRTPLSTAKMSAQLVGRTQLTPERQSSLSGRIVENLNRADKMIENLLDANRIKAGEKIPLKMEAITLNSIVADVLMNLSAIHGDRFKLATPAFSIKGHWSYDGLIRILENLCNNAVKFGNFNTPITISLNQTEINVSISVHNFGSVIPIEDQNKIFDPFQRAIKSENGAIPGWGLGLTLVKGLTESHHGKIILESKNDVGTTFTIVLPNDSRI